MKQNKLKLWLKLEEGYHRSEKIQDLLEQGGIKALGAYFWLTMEALSLNDLRVKLRPTKFAHEWRVKPSSVQPMIDLLTKLDLVRIYDGQTPSEVEPELCRSLPQVVTKFKLGQLPTEQNPTLISHKKKKKEEEERRKKGEGEEEAEEDLRACAREASQTRSFPPPPGLKISNSELRGTVAQAGVVYGYHRGAGAWLREQVLDGRERQEWTWVHGDGQGYVWTWFDFVSADEIEAGRWRGIFSNDAADCGFIALTHGLYSEPWELGPDGRLWAGEHKLVRDSVSVVQRFSATVSVQDATRAVRELENWARSKGADAMAECARAGVAKLTAWMSKPMWKGEKGSGLAQVGRSLSGIGVGIG